MNRPFNTFAPLLLLCLLAADCPPQTAAPAAQDLETWLKSHKAEEFTGQVYARFKVSQPQDLRYNVIIDSETNPYLPVRYATGTVSAQGLQPKPWPEPASKNDWGQPLPWVAPKDENGWLKSGQYSAWVGLPVSTAPQWHTAFIVRPATETDLSQVKLHLEFATAPAEDAIFHVLEEKADSAGAVVVKMPGKGGLEGLKMVESLFAWAQRRRDLVQSLKLSAPPELNEFTIRTWLQSISYRVTGGDAPRERVELDFQNFHDLGINSLGVIGSLNDKLLGELAPKYGIHHIMPSLWAQGARYTSEASNYRDGETVPAHWQRVLDDYYRQSAETLKAQQPSSFAATGHVNLGDEIGQAITIQEIREQPQALAYFREWLQAQGQTAQVKARGESWTPQLFGANRWEEVEPRALTFSNPGTPGPAMEREAANAKATPAEKRRFYWTQRFLDHYTQMFYRTAMQAVHKYFPQVKQADVNFQAGPIQMGFLGNDNEYSTTGVLDMMEMGRSGALSGMKIEDWINIDFADLGIGFNLFGAEVMHAGARKHDLPLTTYIIGYQPYSRIHAWLSQGAKEFDLYLYGPYSNIGPAWGDDKQSLQQVAQATREIKKWEGPIAAARKRPTKAAMLVAYTSETMQGRGLYFPMERQQLYIALRHSGVPIDIVSEQEIAEDEILKNYTLLFVGDPEVRADVQQKIAGWVQNGGHLWAEAGAMNWDEYSELSRVMEPVFGVSKNEAVLQAGGLSWGAPFWQTTTEKMAFSPQGKIHAPDLLGGAGEVTAWGFRLNAMPTTGKVVGTYEDGKPAIVLNSHGKGQALLVGALVGEAYARAHWPKDVPVEKRTFESGQPERALAAALVPQAGVERPIELSVPGVYSSILDTPDGALIFLNNASGRPLDELTVQLNEAGKVLHIESLKRGKLTPRSEQGRLVVEIPLKDTDILRVSR